MLRFTISALLLVLPATTRAGDAPPKGELTKYTFAASKIFPGTTRDYWLYVPKQYDPAKPACVHVNQDGVQFNAPAVFDQLIHKKEMPIVIGVFITPGRVPATTKDALDRFNRSYEYDGLGDAYARFLLEELLPEVEKKTANDGRAIKLSRDPNDRCIAGSSSGAIAAFTAAWERPDAFRRVFSAIGTYVGLRGGNSYPTLIRKFEPKPIRVFLEDGSGDQNSYGGDWWMANQEMERALTFAGYEVNHAWGAGGHDNKHATQIFPDAMRWLWKDHPTPIKAGAGSDKLKEILLPGEEWKLVKSNEYGVAGLAVDLKGDVHFYSGGKKIASDGYVRSVKEKAGGINQVFGPRGLWHFDGDKLYHSDAEGDKFAPPKIVAEGFSLDHTTKTYFNSLSPTSTSLSTHHLVATHTGIAYLTTSATVSREGGFGGREYLEKQPRGLTGFVSRVSADGDKKYVDQMAFPTGVCLSPDQSLLYVADGNSHWVYSYQIQPDGTLKHKQRFYHLHIPDDAEDAGAGGMRVDRAGRLYVATRLGIQVCDQAGRVNCIIPTPNGKVFNLVFGGPKFDILYAACGDRIYSRKTKVQGANAFQAPIKPTPPRL